MMLRVTASELAAKLAEYLRRVQQGETIEVVENGRTIAQLSGPPPARDEHAARLADLERRGIVRPPKVPPDPHFLDRHPPIPCSADAVQILIEQRGGM